MSGFAEKGASTPPPAKGFARRDHLRANEVRIQREWEESKVHESHVQEGTPKYMVTFPYPYMNGRLHLGHAFSLTKAEFTARFQQLMGKNVLFPFGFHCTGMPIQAAANKIRDEMEAYGNPPVFPAPVSTDVKEEAKEKSAEEAIAAKSKGKKSKLIVKGQSGPTRQWDILSKMVPADEIASFADPMKWLTYFPPLGVEDLKAFGSAIDWRRTFITTAVNPFYDAFVRWQFNVLFAGKKIKSGFRPNVYSPKDRQVCADHDRSSGEGVAPQEYTLIKLLVCEPYPEGSPLLAPELAGKKIYLAPATLRPETMYGQTNCFVLPEGKYGAFEWKNGDVFIMSERSAIGLAHQDYAHEWGQTRCLARMTGAELIGLPLKAPMAQFERIYTLPLLTISMGKGTGVVTSVPSDAPDDFVALRELKDKPLWREKFGLTAEMVEPFDVVPIIEIPGYGNTSAVTLCERLDIKSTKDTEKLKQAKDEVYLKGFYEGVMTVGQCTGMKVCDAKPIVRKTLLDSGDAVGYYEPESLVMSRSGEECVVALTDQWYLSYAEPEWNASVHDHLNGHNFTGYNPSVLDSLNKALDWLKEWACSRQFGLGTQLPWDVKWVIDSLSDSTLYMAYYTIAHYFHGSPDNMTGENGPYNITGADVNDDVFNFIFLRKPMPESASTNIPASLLEQMQKEFEYWYPMDLRVSAKDLIPNHLTMCLYNHAEIFKDRPELWPRGIYCNGHIMVDAEKMSKSRGNFLMLLECCNEYSTDATRFALADAGDTLEDANFDRNTANAAVSNLFVEEEWIVSMVADRAAGKLRAANSEEMFMDKSFDNEIDFLLEATLTEFERINFREGMHRCWYDMVIARDLYRDWSQRTGIPMHERVAMRFAEALVLTMTPICPHWSENLLSILTKDTAAPISVKTARWPAFKPYNRSLRKEYLFFRDFMKNIRTACLKKKVAGPKSAHVYLTMTYTPHKVTVLEHMQTMCDANGKFTDDFAKAMKSYLENSAELKADTKILMQFASFMKAEALERGIEALSTVLQYDQKAILEVCNSKELFL